jgi:hypothetical protein
MLLRYAVFKYLQRVKISIRSRLKRTSDIKAALNLQDASSLIIKYRVFF